VVRAGAATACWEGNDHAYGSWQVCAPQNRVRLSDDEVWSGAILELRTTVEASSSRLRLVVRAG
jgi:hypothetical protein